MLLLGSLLLLLLGSLLLLLLDSLLLLLLGKFPFDGLVGYREANRIYIDPFVGVRQGTVQHFTHSQFDTVTELAKHTYTNIYIYIHISHQTSGRQMV